MSTWLLSLLVTKSLSLLRWSELVDSLCDYEIEFSTDKNEGLFVSVELAALPLMKPDFTTSKRNSLPKSQNSKLLRAREQTANRTRWVNQSHSGIRTADSPRLVPLIVL